MENNNNRKKKYYFLYIILFTLFFNPVKAQTLQDSIISYFNILQTVPQEKLYLHLDKPFYGTGENIWFKGYLLNATTHKDDALTNYITTELVNQQDSVIIRKIIKRDSLGFIGNIELSPDLPQGNYYIKGYSNRMRNEKPDFFYYQPLIIGNSIDTSIQSDIEYYKENEHNYLAKIKFINQQKNPFKNTKVKYTLTNGNNKIIKRGYPKTNEEGIITFSLPKLEENLSGSVIEVEFYDPAWVYQRKFYLPSLTQDFDVQFFPEGGDLLSNIRQRVAFKLQKSDGNSGTGKGILRTIEGDSITSFETEHNGMGVICFTPKKEELYIAEVTSSQGITKRFSLPEPKEKGFSITLNQHKENFLYEIIHTETTDFPPTLFLIAHSRGNICILKKITTGSLTGKINKQSLPEGIIHFLLVNEKGKSISERLCFVSPPNLPTWNLTSNKEKYSEREKVLLKIKGINKYGEPLQGDFSVSITDAQTVMYDSLSNNIVSNLLLTSDLKGHIENPGYYFLSSNTERDYHLDLIMLTHGWRRFKVEDLRNKPKVNTQHFIEQTQSFSGKVKGLFGGKVKKGSVIAISPKLNITKDVKTDNNGEFIIENLNFSDSTKFIIQASNKRGFKTISISIDPQEFAPPYRNFPFPEKPILNMDDYLMNIQEKYFSEGGTRVIRMKEVVITASRATSYLTAEAEATASEILLEKDLAKMSGFTIQQVLNRLPGIRIMGQEIRIRGNNNPPAIVIDDILYGYSIEALEAIPINNIAVISVSKGATSYSNSGGGTIYIYLKEGSELPTIPPPGIKVAEFIGYSEPAEFYHPTYETPAQKMIPKPDVRTTLYWNPSLCFDPNGEGIIEYYTSDNSITHNIEIEGIDRNGNIYRYFDTIGK